MLDLTHFLELSNIVREEFSKIAFLGSANAMGMMYALELRNAGHDVLYVVTTPPADSLSRPECHFPQVQYPYEDWIHERLVKNPLRANVFAEKFLPDLISKLDEYDLVVLSGSYLMLALYLKKAKIAFLSHGSDLDVWCNKDNYWHHLKKFFLGQSLVGSIASLVGISKMRRAFSKCDLLVTFPEKLSPQRDKVVFDLVKNWAGEIIYRFDISFCPLDGISRTPPLHKDRLVLLCAVRCSFVPEAGVSPSDMKGVDVIIRGVANYKALKRMPVELHIIEKGKDLKRAKSLCKNLGLSDSVVWHKEMPFRKLLSFYESADICFDQVSDSWLGAVGCYGLFLGRPLIANSRKDILSKLWVGGATVCEATTESDVSNWLVRLEDPTVRLEIGRDSATFAEESLGPLHVTQNLIRYLGDLRDKNE